MIFAAPGKPWLYVAVDGRIVWAGGHLDLTAHEAAAWGVLERAFPHKVTWGALQVAVYPGHLPDADVPRTFEACVRVAVSRSRRRLAAAGAPITISRATQFGLCIEIVRLPAAAQLPAHAGVTEGLC